MIEDYNENELTIDEIKILKLLANNVTVINPIYAIQDNRVFEYDYDKNRDCNLFTENIKDYFNELDIYIDFYRDKLIFKL